MIDLIFKVSNRSNGSDIRWKAIPQICSTAVLDMRGKPVSQIRGIIEFFQQEGNTGGKTYHIRTELLCKKNTLLDCQTTRSLANCPHSPSSICPVPCPETSTDELLYLLTEVN